MGRREFLTEDNFKCSLCLLMEMHLTLLNLMAKEEIDILAKS